VRATVVVGLAMSGFALVIGCNRGVQPASTLVVAVNGDPGALNPAVTTSGNTHPVTDQIFNGLVGLDESLNPVPELAERWSVEDGGRVYRFALRRGVLWHDGRPFTSDDVKFTFEEALLKYHSRTRAALQDLVSRIDATTPHEVVFTLKRAYGPLLQRLDVVEASIIPRHAYAHEDLLTGTATRQPIGTGPFRFVSYAPADRIVLERNADYFRPGRPGVARLVFRIMPNTATAVAALEKGEVDYVGGVAGPEVERLRHTPGIAVVAGTGGSGGSICQDVLVPNLSRRPLDDVRVRRAIATALDRQFIVDRVYFGQGRPATGPISHLLAWAYTADVRQYPHDDGVANRLLDESGLKRAPDGRRFSITFTHAATQQRLAQAVREQLRAVGIDVNLQTLDFNAAVDQVFVKKRFDLGMASFCNGADPDIGVRRVYVSSNIGPIPFSNGAGYVNPRVDRLFDEASQLTDRNARRTLYMEIQRILTEDVPYFWIIDSEGLRAYRTAFDGFRLWTGAFAETVHPVHDPR
jgi:peptide/nickel transport system substrate-binding protein